MEEILKKYEDKNKFITELYSLYKELIGFGVSKEEVLKIINKIYLSNIDIKIIPFLNKMGQTLNNKKGQKKQGQTLNNTQNFLTGKQ